jgi:hypothetical protein
VGSLRLAVNAGTPRRCAATTKSDTACTPAPNPPSGRRALAIPHLLPKPRYKTSALLYRLADGLHWGQPVASLSGVTNRERARVSTCSTLLSSSELSDCGIAACIRFNAHWLIASRKNLSIALPVARLRRGLLPLNQCFTLEINFIARVQKCDYSANILHLSMNATKKSATSKTA